MVQQLAIVEPEILDRFDIDCIELGRGFCLDASDWKPWVLPDGTPCRIPVFLNVEKEGGDWYLLHEDGTRLGVQKKGCLYFEQCYYPWEGQSVEEVDLDALPEVLGRTMWTACLCPGANLPMTDEGLAQLAEGAKNLRKSTDRAILGLFGGNMFELPQWLFRMDHWLLELALHPDGAMRLHERLCEIHLKNLQRWLSAVGPSIDVVVFGDDLGVPARADNLAGNVSQMSQAVSCQTVATSKRACQSKCQSSLLWWNRTAAAGADQCRSGHGQSGPNLVRTDGAITSEASFWQPDYLLGWWM